MNLLITGAATDLGRLLATGLCADHTLRLTDQPARAAACEPVPDGAGVVPADLDAGEDTDRLVTGIDAILHLPHVAAPDEPASQWLDAHTRCTYNLLVAAAAAGVKRVLCLSTLDIFRAYESDLAVAEDWRPRPSLEPGELGPYMSEFVAREFAHSGQFEIVVLRLGHVVTAAAALPLPFDPMWVDARDVVGGVLAALEQPVAEYAVFHLQHTSDRARFGVRREPRHQHRGQPGSGPPQGQNPRPRRPGHSLAYTPLHGFEAQP